MRRFNRMARIAFENEIFQMDDLEKYPEEVNSKILSSYKLKKRGKTEIIDKKGGSRGREYIASRQNSSK